MHLWVVSLCLELGDVYTCATPVLFVAGKHVHTKLLSKLERVTKIATVIHAHGS